MKKSWHFLCRVENLSLIYSIADIVQIALKVYVSGCVVSPNDVISICVDL